MNRITQLETEWQDVITWLDQPQNWQQPHPLSAICKWARDTLSTEAEEMLHSILMEPFGDDIDHLCSDMSAIERPVAAKSCQVKEMIGWITRDYNWALDTGFE